MRIRITTVFACCVLISGCGGTEPGPTIVGEPHASTTVASTTSAVSTEAPLTTAAPTTAATPTTTQPPVTTTLVRLEPTEAVALADSFYEAVNSGNLAEAFSIASVTGDRHTAIAGFSAHFEWACASDSGDTVVCDERITDSFYGPAGFVHEGTITYAVRNGGLQTKSDACFAEGRSPNDDLLAYVQAFDRWLQANYPNTPGWIRLFAGEGLPNWMDGRPCRMYSLEGIGNADTIASYVQEFVTQSDDYP